MEEIKIILPKLGESIVSATVVKWLKKEGDQIDKDENLLEVSTDKVNSEIPSPVAGILDKILVHENEEVQVGEPLAIVKTGEATKQETPIVKETAKTDYFSPAVLKLAEEKGISLSDLEKIKGTGDGGRISRKDLENFAVEKKEPVKGQTLKLSALRRKIAENMVTSHREIPSAVIIDEIDVTDIVELIDKNKESFLKKHGAKLTITPFLAKAIGKAAKKFPLVNSSLKEDVLILKPEVNLGLAVGIEDGVMVPVIKNIAELDFVTIAKKIFELANKARTNSLIQNEIIDGTITLTNFGMTQILIGIPIIRYPESAIIGLGAIKKKAAVIDDEIKIRSMMHIALSFDHRVFDGIYGCSFINEIKSVLAHDKITL
ncbi:MAG: 2-oxo acid dehydrogenase subunit E2 [Chlamydiae bacterium]|nr:2-oxo acid dehydrogenase subunit E2 [Chlamydiota bacterium]